MKIEKAWVIRETDPELVLQISATLKVSAPIARFLIARGYTTPEQALDFINADLDLLENPFKLSDMTRAVDRLLLAKARGEKVFIAGDRDVDGVTSTVLMVNLLNLSGIACAWRVPTLSDGYGLNATAVEAAAASGASLIISVDCGVRDFEGVELARAKGMDVVVLDHHEPGPELPPAFAVVDPKRSDSAYSFNELAACAVCFKFAQAFLMAGDEEFYQRDIVVFDVETSGGSAASGEIIEIGAIKAKNGVEIDRFHSLIKPEKCVPRLYTDIHGIDDAMLADAPPAREVIERFLAFIEGATLVAHNAAFDVKFLKDQAKRLFGVRVKNPVIDTLKLARQHYPAADHSLGGLAAKLEIEQSGRHRALADAETCFVLYRRLLARVNAKMQAFLKASLDLVVLSTLADVVPLVQENRVLVRMGLDAFRRSPRPGVVALRDALVRAKNMTAKDIAWSVVPVLNAAGRMGETRLAVELLLAQDGTIARDLLARLVAMNTERKEKTRTSFEVVSELLAREFDPETDAVAVLAVRDIEHGVSGVLANRILNEIGRPVVILVDDDGECIRGTARSIADFDISAALTRLAPLLEKYGGHKAACGLTLKRTNLDAFRRELNDLIRREVPIERLQPRLEIDAVVDGSEINAQLLKDLDLIEPTGHGNGAPVFCVRDAEVAEVRRMGDASQHVKLTVRAGGDAPLEMVAWNAANAAPAPGDRIDVAFGVERSEWRGRVGIQCVVEDIRRRA